MYMKVYVINLDKDSEKLAFIDRQCRKLGIDYTRISGVYGKDMDDDEQRRAVDAFRWWCAVGRPVVPAEIGVALSHASIYRRMEPNEAVCVFEDDVFIGDDFSDRLADVENVIDTTRPQVYLFSDHQKHFSGDGVVRSNDGICADGYVITQPAAAFVLRENFPMKVPCDHWFRWAREGHIELYHVLPACVRQNQEQFGTSTQANAEEVSEYTLVKWCLHKGKRVIGKLIDIILLKLGR